MAKRSGTGGRSGSAADDGGSGRGAPPGPIEAATRAQLRAAGILLGRSGLARAAVGQAALLDVTVDAGKFAVGLAQLRIALAELEDVRAVSRPATAAATEAPVGDSVDELAARRDRPVS